MGYQVRYGPVNRPRRKRSGLAALTGIFFLLFLGLVVRYWPQGRSVLEQILHPGEKTVMAAALETMAQSLRQGEGIRESLGLFWERILNALH